MIRIYSLVEIHRVTRSAIRRRPDITSRVTGHAFRGKVRACEWKICRIVVKNYICIAGWVTGKAGRAIESVSADPFVLVVRFRVGVASCAGENGIIRQVRVAVCTSIPLSVVLAAVNRETVVVESRRRPGCFCVTALAIGGKLERNVVRICRFVVLR